MEFLSSHLYHVTVTHLTLAPMIRRCKTLSVRSVPLFRGNRIQKFVVAPVEEQARSSPDIEIESKPHNTLPLRRAVHDNLAITHSFIAN